MQHEADGIFYIDVAMVDKLRPCSAWRRYINHQCAKAPGGRVVITMDVLMTAVQYTSQHAQPRLSAALRQYGRISFEEECHFDHRYWDAMRVDRARVTMDMLAHVARKRGLLK